MYINILKKVIILQEDLFQSICYDDFSLVNYQGIKDNQKGLHDEHYVNRLRLSYYLLLEHKDTEMIVKRLFEEELKDRETNSFQGIGTCLEILTYLLMKYNQGQYDELFQRAKQANFDCCCGYDPHINIASEYEEYDFIDCLYICVELDYLIEARKLVDSWKESVEHWDQSAYENLVRFHQYTKQEIFNEEPLQQLLDISKKTKINQKDISLSKKQNHSIQVITSWLHLLDYYIQFESYEKAYHCFQDMISEVDFTPIQHIRLFDSILEDCLELMIHDEKRREELWKWVKPFLQKKDQNMYGNLYEKSIIVAQMMNDEYMNEINQKYIAWQKKMQIWK